MHLQRHHWGPLWLHFFSGSPLPSNRVFLPHYALWLVLVATSYTINKLVHWTWKPPWGTAMGKRRVGYSHGWGEGQPRCNLKDEIPQGQDSSARGNTGWMILIPLLLDTWFGLQILRKGNRKFWADVSGNNTVLVTLLILRPNIYKNQPKEENIYFRLWLENSPLQCRRQGREE